MTDNLRVGFNPPTLELSKNHSNTAEEDSLATKLVREAYVIGGGSALGMVNSAVDAIDNPWSTAAKATAGLAIASALTLASKGRGVFAPTVAKTATTALGAAFVMDLADRDRLSEIGTSISQTWSSSEGTDQHLKTIGKHVGPLAFDTVLMAASGIAGAKIASGYLSRSGGSILPAPEHQLAPSNNPVPTRSPAETAQFDRLLSGASASPQIASEIPAPKMTYRPTEPGISDHRWGIERAKGRIFDLGIPENHPNPLLKAYEIVNARGKLEDYSHSLIRYYAHSVPTEEALAFIAQHGPIVEAGAGNGYWAALLRARNTPVVAYDKWTGSAYKPEVTWTEIITGDASAVANHPKHTLFLSWPSGNAAFSAVTNYKGSKLLYLGELDTAEIMADQGFINILARDFRLLSKVDTPRLQPYVRDSLYLFERKSRAEKLLERHRAKVAERSEREARKND